MKTKIFTLALVATILCSGFFANAKIRRVGYIAGTAIPGQDYNDLQTAHDAANAGDTLLMFPVTSGNTWTATFTKQLVVIGYGYYLNSTNLGTGANDSLQATLTGPQTISITLNAGSGGTILEGLDGLYVNINALDSNLVISRCNFTMNWASMTGGSIDNLQITQSVINSIIGGDYNTVTQFTNLLVENCIVGNSGDGGTGGYIQLSSSSSYGIFMNDIFFPVQNDASPNFTGGTYNLSNNIFVTTTAPSNDASCMFFYNIASNNTIPAGPGEQPNVNIDSVFVGYPNAGSYSYDERYALAPNSPAKGAGAGAGGTTTDCGIFGGSTPYHLSGIPPVPSFYALYPSYYGSVTTNPFKIYFSVRGNN